MNALRLVASNPLVSVSPPRAQLVAFAGFARPTATPVVVFCDLATAHGFGLAVELAKLDGLDDDAAAGTIEDLAAAGVRAIRTVVQAATLNDLAGWAPGLVAALERPCPAGRTRALFADAAVAVGYVDEAPANDA